MKILVTYFTLTGNTEKIAKAIYDEVSKEHEADLKKIDEVNPDTFNGYDLVFVGTPAHAGDLAGPVKEVMSKLPSSSVRAAFENVVKEKGIEYLGTYNCMGKPDPNVAKMVKEARKMPDDEFNKYMEEAKKHPSPEDEQKAKEFAKEVLSKI
ncbi:MAG: flavodoxin family protein [Candidatus Freyarchaeota archaeon]